MPSSKKRKLAVHGRKRTHPATSEDDMIPDLNSVPVAGSRRTSKESIPSRISTSGNPFIRKLKHGGASGSSSSKQSNGDAQASSSRGMTGASTSGQQEVGESRDQRDRNRKDSNRKSDKHHDSARIITDLKQKVKKIEQERSKMEAKLTDKKDELNQVKEKLDEQTKQLAKTKKEKDKLKRTSERLQRDKEQLETSSKKFKKKMESYRTKLTEAETENNKLSARIARLELESKKKTNTDASCVPGPSGQVQPAGGTTGEPNLFQDMMDNFRELAETQLQCVICSELIVEAVSINCGHSFCDHCIHEWKRKKNNCPVCRTTIKSINPVKILDEYADKVYEQFVGEGARQTRGVLKEERAKLKKELEAARRTDFDLAALSRRIPALDSGSESDDDSDTTLEIRFNSDLDSDVSDEIVRYFSDTEISDIVDIEQDDQPSFPDYRRHLNRLLDSDPSSYDSTDSDFSVSRLNPNRERTRRIRSSDSESSSSSASSRSVSSPTSLSDVDSSSEMDTHDILDILDFQDELDLDYLMNI